MLLEVVTVPLRIVLGVALAWLTERTDLPGARVWAWLAVAPLAVPAFVQSYAWISVVPGLDGLFAGGADLRPGLFPVRLPAGRRAAAPPRSGDRGHRGVARPRRLARPSSASCCRSCASPSPAARCWSALHLLAEYGLFAMIRFDTFTTAIIDQFQSTFNGPAANMLAGVLVFLLPGPAAGGGLQPRQRPVRPDRLGRPAARRCAWRLALPGAARCADRSRGLAFGVPLMTLVRWLMLGGAEVWGSPAIVGALGQTLVLALGAAVVTTLAALPDGVAVGARRRAG